MLAQGWSEQEERNSWGFLGTPSWGPTQPLPLCLSSKVPLCACSLCSTRECLYVLSSHDIEHHPTYRDLPASRVAGTPEPSLGAGAAQDPGGVVARACEQYLSQIHSCPTLQDRMEKMKEVVGWMPLMAAQKDFFWEALEIGRASCRERVSSPV